MNYIHPINHGAHAEPIDVDFSTENGEDALEEHEAGYPLAADETMSAPAPFAVSTRRDYRDPDTGRLAFIARPEHGGALSRNQRVLFKAQAIPGVFRERAYFVAQRQGRGRFAIFNVYNDNAALLLPKFSKDDPRYVGEMRREIMHNGLVHYTLYRSTVDGKTPVATTIYDKSSLSYPVVNGSPDRIAYSVVHNNTGSNKSCNDNNATSSKYIKSSMQQVQEAPDHVSIHETVNNLDKVELFQSKRRFTNGRGQTVHADIQSFRRKYGGRALLSSKKNLQLMNVSSGKDVFQMGRLSRETFSVDFLPPYTPFQAFGLALAQLDAN